MRLTRCWPTLLLIVPCLAGAQPFPARDQNAFATLFGMPGPLPTRMSEADAWATSFDYQWSNTSSEQENDVESLVVDGEAHEFRLSLGRAVAERWHVQLQIPYRRTEAGSLDSFIDDWHGWFGLPEGTRRHMPKDRLLVSYARNGTTLLDVRNARSGLGDAVLNVGYSLYDTTAGATSAWVSIKAPTGKAEDLTGSGSLDAAIALAGDWRLGERWSAFAQAGVTYLGDGDLLPEQQRSVVWNGMAGVAARVYRGLSLKAQLDGRTALYDDTTLDFFGEALMLTVGGDYRFANGWVLDLGVSEDLAVETTTDVTFVFSLRSEW